MHTAIMLLGCTLGGCTAPPPVAHAHAVLDGPDGPGTVLDLNRRYADLAMDCAGEPAVRCTGILLESSDDRDPWQPFADNGVPMSWFRRDAPILETYTPQAGMIYYAADASAQFGKRAMKVSCAYVLNAFTDYRQSRCDGFGTWDQPESGPCQPQGIVSADTWFAHMRRNPYPSQAGGWQCGFDLTAVDRTAVFAHFPEMMRAYQIPGQAGAGFNELVVQSWQRDEPETVPIEAFFYNADPSAMPASRERARALQVRMNDAGGIWRPVVEMRFPATAGDAVLFCYNDVDQARPAPAER